MKSESCYALCRFGCLIEQYTDSENITELEACRRWEDCPDYESKIKVVNNKIERLNKETKQ